MTQAHHLTSSRPGTAAGALFIGFHWIATSLALAAYVLLLAALLGGWRVPGKSGWLDILLVFMAAMSAMTALSRHLPAQNVMLAAIVMALIGGAAHALSAATGLPFGPITFSDEAGPGLHKILPLAIPLLWVVAVLNSRGVARLMLRPWRRARHYGFWLLGVTAVLTVAFDFALEPFAGRVRQYWQWGATKLPFSWYDAPVTNVTGWLLATLLILAFASPALINKRPQPAPSKPDWHPLVAWVLAMALFGIGAVRHDLVPAAIVSGVLGACVAGLAIRGARF